MSPTETRTMSSTETDDARCCSCGPGWLDLPAVIRATFDCTRNVTLHQSRESMGASADPLGPVLAIYPTGQGAPVVTVWHDRIESDAIDPRRAGRNAPDIVMWALESTADEEFRLRRPKAPAVHA